MTRRTVFKSICLLPAVLLPKALAQGPCSNWVEGPPIFQQSTSVPQGFVDSFADARCFKSINYTVQARVGSYIRVWLFGSNTANFTHERIVESFDVPGNTVWNACDIPAVFGYYRLKLMTVPGKLPGLLTATMFCKR